MASTAIAEAAERLDSRLNELRPLVLEYQHIEALRKQMAQEMAALPAPATATPVVSTGNRNKHGETMNAVKDLVISHPEGIKVKDISESLEKHPSYIYAVVGRLIDRGTLYRDNDLIKPRQKRSAPARQRPAAVAA